MKKNLFYSFLLIIILGSCKKDEQNTSYTKYDVSFTIKSSLAPISIAFTEASGNLRTEIVNQPGLKFAYGSVRANDQLFVTASKVDKIEGWVKCQWEIKGVPFYNDSVWLPDTVYFHTFNWIVPK